MKTNTLLLILMLFAHTGRSVATNEMTTFQQQTRKLAGQVKDTKGEILIGVSVSVEGTTTGTVTDMNGNFSVNIPSGNQKIAVSYIGYDKQVVAVGANQTDVAITLKENMETLDEVVVIGYGSARKRDLTGAVAQVKTETLQKESPGSVQDLLRSNVAGLNIGVTRDAKGGGGIEIRGQKSLLAGNSPLIVLDGVIFNGELSEINPNDIAQIDVLKDASSAAVYGSRSAAGVLIITTKKGKSGKPIVNFDANIGFSDIARNMEVYDSQGYLDWRQKVQESINASAKPGEFAKPTPENLAKYGITLEQWMAYRPGSGDPEKVWLSRLGLFGAEIDNYFADRIYDWNDASFQNGFRQNYNSSVSGNSENINYYFSLGYMNNEGVIIGDIYSTYRSNLKMDMDVTKWLNIGVNVNFQDRSQDGQVVNWAGQIINNSPYSQPTDSLGNMVHYPMGTNSGGSINSQYEIGYRKQRDGWTVLNNILSAKVKLPLNITYQMNFSPRLEFHYWQKHESSKNPEWKASNNGLAERQSRKIYGWQVDNILRWEQTFAKKHQFEVTLLQNAEETKQWEETMTGRNLLPSDALGYHYMDLADMTRSSIKSNDWHETGDAMMARLFYVFDRKYMLTGTIRQDGSSAFGQSYPRATFPSMALGWIFSEESFFKLPAMNYGKLRVSYGENGNRLNPSDRYISLSEMTLGSGKYPYLNSTGTAYELPQLYASRMANPHLKWETTTAINLGLDFGFLDNRIGGSVEVYKMSTSDLLVKRKLSSITSYADVASNLGEVQNKGFEITLNTVNIKNDNFEWKSNVSFSLNRNKIIHLYYDYEDVLDANGNVIGQKEKDDITNKWFIGHEIGEKDLWGYKIVGIWQTEEKAEAVKMGQVPGDPKIWDVDGNGKYNDGDKVFQGSSSPRFRWTFRNDFTIYKNFDLSFVLYSFWGQKQLYDRPLNKNGFIDRSSSYVMGYWTPDNPTNDYARLYSNDKNLGAQFVREKSFIRLDNISLSYRVPKDLINKVGIQDLKLYGSVRNVGVWSPDWDFWDPETARNPYSDDVVSGPAPRTWTLGLSFTL